MLHSRKFILADEIFESDRSIELMLMCNKQRLKNENVSPGHMKNERSKINTFLLTTLMTLILILILFSHKKISKAKIAEKT